MVYCWRAEGCGQERARESKDDRLGSSPGSLLANSTTGVLATNIEKYVLCSWCLASSSVTSRNPDILNRRDNIVPPTQTD